MPIQAHQGALLHCLGDPSDSEDAIEYIADGLLVVEDGVIKSAGARADELKRLPRDCPVVRHDNALITPGFVDAHIHYPQCEIIAAYGAQLLQWLEEHTFPAESRFGDAAHASQVAEFFLQQLLANGTTTALVFGSVHAESVDAFFQAAEARNLRMICGKVMMDRNAPKNVCDTPQTSYDDSARLIRKWHNKGRLGYAVTPRFAPTSSPAQLRMAEKLLQEFPDVHLHTHLSENKSECEWVGELFPQNKNYLDVYDAHNLLGRRSVFAHAIHLHADEWRRLGESDSNIAHCPMSNLFIGSGLFDFASARAHNIRVGLGTDVGGGDSFSQLRNINQAYKVQQLRGNNLSPFQSLYMATLGGATALDLHDRIGNFAQGKEADFVVLDCAATELIRFRMRHCKSLLEKLFVLQMLGDERAVRETWVMGEKVL